MNHTSTVAALREVADTLEDRYPGDGGRPAAALRIRDIATTLERQGGALDLAAMAERLEAAAEAINAAAERLEALMKAPPDMDVPGAVAVPSLRVDPVTLAQELEGRAWLAANLGADAEHDRLAAAAGLGPVYHVKATTGEPD